MDANEQLTGPVSGADHREVGGVQVDLVNTGNGRVKRLIYPAGFRWSVNMKPFTRTELCMHAHVGFLAQGSIGVEFADGCRQEYTAPAILAIEPGHEGWVTPDAPAVVIEFEFERETVERLGMPAGHSHR
jgi:hypothetical protein